MSAALMGWGWVIAAILGSVLYRRNLRLIRVERALYDVYVQYNQWLSGDTRSYIARVLELKSVEPHGE